jgi:hypothetical protein
MTGPEPRRPDPATYLAAAAASNGSMRAETTSAAEITMKRARWLWQGKIPLGELTIAAGREGVAKSQFSIWEAMHVTRGTTEGELNGQPRPVIICAREDSWEHTIKPRLVAAGADVSLVYRVQVRNITSGKSFDLTLPMDNEILEAEITRLGAALVIFDPLLSVLSAVLNTHRASDVRLALEPLADIAHRTGCAMLGLAHFAKTEGRDAAALISGSHAFKDVARAILVFARDGDDTGVMSQVKNNLGRLSSLSLAYSIDPKQVEVSDGWAEVPVFTPSGETARHVEDLLDGSQMRAMARARDLLRTELSSPQAQAQGGWVLSKDIEQAASVAGIASRTLDRARQELGVIPKKNPQDGSWWIRLPQ